MHDIVNAFWRGRDTLKKTQEVFFDNSKKPKKACVIGAIYYGLYKKADDNAIPTQIALDYPEFRKWVPVPCGHDTDGGYVSSILIHLNDEHSGHDWPDKKIMEWAESVL